MKRILSSSALTILLASGAAYAQDGTPAIFANVPSDPSMLLGTDYIGQSVYSTLATEADAPVEEAATGEAPVDGATDTVATTEGEPAPAQPQRVGDISDIIMTQDGQVEYVILGVGGFLGIGEQNVAVDFGALTMQPDPQNAGEMMIMISATQEQIENAPEFDPMVIEGEAQTTQTDDTGNVVVETETQVEDTTEEVVVETENTAEEAANETEQAVEGAANETEQAVEGAAESTGNALDEAASEAGQAVEQTGDVIENVTDEATTAN